MNRCAFTSLSLVSFVFLSLQASAQPPETIGIRAQGMAGAFTAVADDATAAWWNPAGLAAGASFNAILETNSQREPAAEDALPAWDAESRGFSVAYPALALSYYRLRVSEIQPIASTGDGADSRQDQRSGEVRLRSTILSQFGATVGQSLGNHLVLASTLKLVRGSLASSVRPANEASLAAASELEADSDLHAGLDVGALAKFGRARFGVMVRNVRRPEFETEVGTVELDRQVRAGIAFASTLAVVAADMDVTTQTTATGNERRFAAGAEAWSESRRVGLRGGVSVNTVGERRPFVSGGVSAAFRPGTFVDVAGTLGRDDSRRGWGVALRVTF